MGKNHADMDIINAELNFLRIKFEQAFRERDFRKLKGLSMWIHKLEKKMERIQQKSHKNNFDYIREYKGSKKINDGNRSLTKSSG